MDGQQVSGRQINYGAGLGVNSDGQLIATGEASSDLTVSDGSTYVPNVTAINVVGAKVTSSATGTATISVLGPRGFW